jgi:hypothetical protein
LPRGGDGGHPAGPDLNRHRAARSASVQLGFGKDGGMSRKYSLRFLLPAAVLAASALSPAAAADREDHDRARAALEAGQIRPLSEILAEMERRYMGRVIETELEREDGRWVYEFKLLPPTGPVFELEVDAATGALLGSEGPVQERR